MSKFRPPLTAALTRRAALAGLATAFASPAIAAGEDAAVVYMKKVAKDMLAAHRQGTVASFKRAILRHADVGAIADYSLGQYRARLTPAQKQAYYAGTASFMARYFADQSREYVVSKYEIGDADGDGDDINVGTKVYLVNGQSYTVVWRLGKRGSGFKVEDVKVLGFSLTYLQRGIFTSFLSKRDGDVAQLVAALNR
ncbi:ABC transporter substrate-binding protein [Aestuariivirga sp.]|uniref:Tgt2/MlaC family protein n=1 Tax=Aestuariivirga sp. TaxID=2650926 RepID=UPI0025BC24FF|nr:ABC transporter substrate-binding protein [Aestuariivirga sp.]MCA3555573.1 ABC transporter substrate-binding protein [Aestuariivirga sp.]